MSQYVPNFRVSEQMEGIRHLFKFTLDEEALRYIESAMDCAVQSAICDHVKANNQCLQDMKTEVA